MKRKQRAWGAAAVVAALLLAGPPAFASPAPGAPGVGDVLWPTAGNGGYRVERQRLSFDFPADLETYTATSQLALRATQSLSRFDLDLLGPQVREVKVDGRQATWQSTSDGELVITPPRPIRDGARFTVSVTVFNTSPDLAAHPPSGPDGLVNGMWRAGNYIQLHNQPVGARRVLAVDDHPSAKAPTTVSITTTGSANSVANGRLVSTTVSGTRTTRVFDEPRPLATHLLQVGVGPFTVVHRRGPDGLDLRHAVPTDMADAVLPQLDKVYPEAIEFLSRRLGRFPGTIAGAYASPTGGALETQGLTWLSAEQLTPENYEANGFDGTVAHEIVHEWFGDSVAPARWSDLWLSEGHARFYEWMWGEAHGRSTLDENARHAYEAHRENWLTKYGPIAAPDPASFEGSDDRPFSEGVYAGGALALYALRQQVGDSTFERIERAWVTENHDNTGSTEKYIATASQVAGQDLGPFLRSWLYAKGTLPPMPGHPDWHAA
ncbi:M1 family metallopeptidase [Amycolatopsis sp. cg5]|uniref:M1 family metallopeptidase n=1 Tax=Amycolatopsis sp. cg5 TaxID=3238802 RepID=UPI003524B12C